VQVISLTWGILALAGMLVGFIPCFGWVNWFNIPFAFLGFIISIVAYASGKSGERNNSLVALILCVLAILLGSKRLAAGFGIF